MDSWYWTIILLGLAILFAFLEVFVPSGGILAFLAGSALLGSVVFAFLENALAGALYVSILAVVVPILLRHLLNLWPRTVMGRQLMLDPETDPALMPDASMESRRLLVGKHGIARSKMMLSGLVEIEGRRWNAVSESEAIEAGEEIVVTRVDGIGMLVRKVPSPPNENEPRSEENEETVPVVEDPFV